MASSTAATATVAESVGEDRPPGIAKCSATGNLEVSSSLAVVWHCSARDPVVTSSLFFLRDLCIIVLLSVVLSSGVALIPESLALRCNSILGVGASQLGVTESKRERERERGREGGTGREREGEGDGERDGERGISSVNNMRKSKNSGLSNAVTDPVSLKVLSWNVAGLAEDCTDIFLSQISMLTDGMCCCCKNVSENWME